MARSYTNVTTSIWDDEEFCALSAGAQRTYFMLITQREITAIGTLALTLRRWAKTCSDKHLEAWLAELTDTNHVVLDEDTEELLVRTFAKWDKGYSHPQRVKAVISTAEAIRSHHLRDIAATELAKLGVTTGTSVPPDRHPDAAEVPVSDGNVVVTEVDHKNTPQPSLHNGGASDPEVAPRPPDYCPAHMPDGTDKPCYKCARHRKAIDRWDAERPQREAEQRARRERERSAAVLSDMSTARANAVPRPRVAS